MQMSSYVKVRVGKQDAKTYVAYNSSSPKWPTDNKFTFYDVNLAVGGLAASLREEGPNVLASGAPWLGSAHLLGVSLAAGIRACRSAAVQAHTSGTPRHMCSCHPAPSPGPLPVATTHPSPAAVPRRRHPSPVARMTCPST